MSDTSPPVVGPLPPPTTAGAESPISSAPTNAAAAASRPPRVGELTMPWRVVMIATWIAVFVAEMAVWKASEEIGIATWWLGPRSNPQPVIVRLVPFLIAVVFGVLATSNVRRFPWISLGGAGILAIIAVPDLSRSTGLALVEFAIAGAVGIISLAASTGMYRADATEPEPPSDR